MNIFIKQTFFAFLVGLALCCRIACATELVLQEKTKLKIRTVSGNITIISGEGIERTYEWNGCSLKADMKRRSYRWYGNLGIYDPAPRNSLSLLFHLGWNCKGISRTVVEEGQIHFADRKSAELWLERYSKVSTTVWSNDGLVARWDLVPDRSQLGVELWQICIAGRWPTELSNAHDDSFSLEGIGRSNMKRYSCAAVSQEVLIETQNVWQEHWRSVDSDKISRFQRK